MNIPDEHAIEVGKACIEQAKRINRAEGYLMLAVQRATDEVGNLTVGEWLAALSRITKTMIDSQLKSDIQEAIREKTGGAP